MLCPQCQTDLNHKVIETRHHEGLTYRRRECLNCKFRFNTKEEYFPFGIPQSFARLTRKRPRKKKVEPMNEILASITLPNAPEVNQSVLGDPDARRKAKLEHAKRVREFLNQKENKDAWFE